MEKQVYSKKTVTLFSVCLFIIASAAFFSMSAFTRPVFGNNWQWQLSFAVLAVCLILSAAVKRSLISLCLAAAATAAMWAVTPFYGGLFLPVALQAVLWEAAREERKESGPVFVVALLAVSFTVPLHIRLWKFLTFNAPSSSDPVGEAYACFIGLILLLAIWTALLIRALRRAKSEKKAPAKKRGRHSKPSTGEKLFPVVYAVCVFNTAFSVAHCFQFFSGEYVKTMLFANGLFFFYLLYRCELFPFVWQQNA